MNFTPGPWWRDDDGFIAAGSGDTYVTLANSDCTQDLNIDERDSNANLIAAAPEMYEALKCMLEVFEYDAEGLECISKARYAITKAEGRLS